MRALAAPHYCATLWGGPCGRAVQREPRIASSGGSRGSIERREAARKGLYASWNAELKGEISRAVECSTAGMFSTSFLDPCSRAVPVSTVLVSLLKIHDVYISRILEFLLNLDVVPPLLLLS